MDDIKIINNEIKELECERLNVIKKFVELSDIEKMNYDLHGDTIILKLNNYLKSINELGYRLHELYRIKDILEKGSR